MPAAWFLAPYKRDASRTRPTRYCAINDLTPEIRADGGDWSETEVLGQQAVVKVSASAATLASVAALPGVMRIPLARLDDPLSTLLAAQRTAIRNRILALGYTDADITAALPNPIGTYTLREVLQMAASRRRKVRYDQPSDTIVDDGPDQPVRPLHDVDAAVV